MAIVREVAAQHGLPSHHLVSPRRTRAIQAARHEAVRAIVSRRPDLPLHAVGEVFGMQSHTVGRIASDIRALRVAPVQIHCRSEANRMHFFPAVTFDEIPPEVEEVAVAHGLPVKVIMGRRRTVAVCRARNAAIRAVAAAYPGASSTAIGALFGRHYSTVLYALGTLGRLPSDLAEVPA